MTQHTTDHPLTRSMLRHLIPLLLVFVVVGWCSGFAEEEPISLQEWRDRVAKISKDMTADEVRKQLGKPTRITRQILFRRHLEQWNYEQSDDRIEFNCFPGEEPRVLNVHRGATTTKP